MLKPDETCILALVEWTDDMTVRIARDRSLTQLVRYLRTTNASRRQTLVELTEQYALSFDDARLAMDRVMGGTVRARSGNPANEPDRVRDPLAWISYRLEQGLKVDDGDAGLTPAQRAAVADLLDEARRECPTRGTEDVAVALEVVRQAVESTEPDRTRYFLLLQAATAVSVAAEACIEQLGNRPCALTGTQEWVDGVALSTSARRIAAVFAAQPDPALEERALMLVGRIATGLLGQSYVHVGRAMVDSARCIQRNHGPEAGAAHAQAMLADFERLLVAVGDAPPQDEDEIAIELLLDVVTLVIDGCGRSPELDSLRYRARQALAGGSPT